MNRTGTTRKFKIEVKLSKDKVTEIFKAIDSYIIVHEHNINDKVTVLVVVREFIRVLVNGIITMTVIIEEKEETISEIVYITHNPVAAEGVVNDLNAGKSTRKELFDRLEPYVLNITEIGQE